MSRCGDVRLKMLGAAIGLLGFACVAAKEGPDFVTHAQGRTLIIWRLDGDQVKNATAYTFEGGTVSREEWPFPRTVSARQ
jgi:hypothetical protein